MSDVWFSRYIKHLGAPELKLGKHREVKLQRNECIDYEPVLVQQTETAFRGQEKTVNTQGLTPRMK